MYLYKYFLLAAPLPNSEPHSRDLLYQHKPAVPNTTVEIPKWAFKLMIGRQHALRVG